MKKALAFFLLLAVRAKKWALAITQAFVKGSTGRHLRTRLNDLNG